MEYKLKYENVGAIKSFDDLTIKKNHLNIKYGLNGVGKSTIIKSLKQKLDGKSLTSFKPFHDTTLKPSIENNDINSVLIFDNNYIESFLFKNDEVLNNSFEIIKSKEYLEFESKVGKELDDLHLLTSSSEFNELSKLLTRLYTDVELNVQKDKLLGSVKFGRGFNFNLDTEINNTNSHEYKKYLTSSKAGDWSDWFQKGYIFSIDNTCPFCLSQLNDEFESKHKVISSSFKKGDLNNYLETSSLINHLTPLIDNTNVEILKERNTSEENLSDSEQILVNLHKEFDAEFKKISFLNSLTPLDFKEKNLNDIKELLTHNKLEESLYKIVSIKGAIDKIKKINAWIDDYINKLTKIISDISNFNIKLKSNIDSMENYVNGFLKSSGIPYEINVIESNKEHKTLLLPVNRCEKLRTTNFKDSLSYGEKNALSLILFIIEAVNTPNLDLIILDDPVSSFDENKKYSIMYYLYSTELKNFNLRDKTSLILTHDLNTIIDFQYNNKPTNHNVYSTYIENNSGILSEKIIEKHHLNLYTKNLLEQAKNAVFSTFTRLRFLRNYYEIVEEGNQPIYNTIASLFHNRVDPSFKDGSLLNDIEISDVLTTLADDFIITEKYEELRMKISTTDKIKSLFNNSLNDEDKITLARLLIMRDKNVADKITHKNLSEHFHLENSLLFELDPFNFNTIPSYVIEEINYIFNS